MKVSLSTRIAMSPDEVWRRVQTLQLLRHIAWPLIRFAPVKDNQWTEHFVNNTPIPARLFLFGFIPFGVQWVVPSLHLSELSAWPKKLRDNGYSALIKPWDHWITVEPDDADGTLYCDDVEMKAGLLTPFIWCFAHIFYRHRQRRWRALGKTTSKGISYDHTA